MELHLAERSQIAIDDTTECHAGIDDQPRSSCSATQPINHTHLAKYTLGDPELEREILQLFVDQLPALVKKLRSADSEQAWYIAAHTLKGSARAVGADQLGDSAAEAERHGENRHRFALNQLADRAQAVIDYVASTA